MENNTNYESNFFPIYQSNFYMYLILCIVSIFCSIAGIGGGALLTPIFYLLGKLPKD